MCTVVVSDAIGSVVASILFLGVMDLSLFLYWLAVAVVSVVIISGAAVKLFAVSGNVVIWDK